MSYQTLFSCTQVYFNFKIELCAFCPRVITSWRLMLGSCSTPARAPQPPPGLRPNYSGLAVVVAGWAGNCLLLLLGEPPTADTGVTH